MSTDQMFIKKIKLNMKIPENKLKKVYKKIFLSNVKHQIFIEDENLSDFVKYHVIKQSMAKQTTTD